MTNEQIAAMAAWTLKDIQNDPLGAVEKVRELAAAHLALQKERDAAVADIEFMLRLSDKSRPAPEKVMGMCAYCRGQENRCRSPKWRGPHPEQVLAQADQSAGEYADNPVLAQA